MTKRTRRWLLVTAATVTALVLVAALALPALLDVERYRERIERELRDATGWNAELGEIDLSILRGLALTVSPAELSAPVENGSRVKIGMISIRAALRPLMRGELEIRSVALNRPVIRVVRADEALGWMLPLPPRLKTVSCPPTA